LPACRVDEILEGIDRTAVFFISSFNSRIVFFGAEARPLHDLDAR
jgi:hypothetical protein